MKTRLRVEEIRETPMGMAVYFKAEGNGMYGFMQENGLYPFPVEYVEKEAAEEGGTFKRAQP